MHRPGIKSFLASQFAALNRRYLGQLHIGLSFHRDTIYLNVLYSYVTAPPGTGSRFMQDLCRLADSVGAAIELSPASEDLNQGESDFKKTTSIARLQDFYSRFGFRVIDENTMRREYFETDL